MIFPVNFFTLLSPASDRTLADTNGRVANIDARMLVLMRCVLGFAALTTVWIDRRHDRPGSGATPPTAPVRPNATFADMSTFAATAVPDEAELRGEATDA